MTLVVYQPCKWTRFTKRIHLLCLLCLCHQHHHCMPRQHPLHFGFLSCWTFTPHSRIMCFQVAKELNFVFIMVLVPFVVFYYTSWNNNFTVHVSCDHGYCPCLLFQVSKRDLPMVLSSKILSCKEMLMLWSIWTSAHSIWTCESK
jgi:hypothetical protein